MATKLTIMETQVLIAKIEEVIATAEKFRKAYFWSSPCNAASRRWYENKYSIAEFEYSVCGNTYTASYEVECSCKHVYAKGYYTKNGQVATLTAIKNSLKQLQNL